MCTLCLQHVWNFIKIFVYVQFLCDVWLLILCTHCGYCVCFLWLVWLRVLSWILHWVGLVLLFIVCFCRYLSFISCITSNIGLWVSMYVSFICSPSILVLYIWYFSSVFRCLPFFSVFKTFIMSTILPYVCPVFSMWFEYPELLLLLLVACIYSWYLVLYVRPLCPIYFNE
jgi:hypothetical protein